MSSNPKAATDATGPRSVDGSIHAAAQRGSLSFSQIEEQPCPMAWHANGTISVKGIFSVGALLPATALAEEKMC